MEARPLSSSSIIMLWPCLRAVAGSSQMLFPILLFPLEWVVGGVTVTISRQGVGEEGTVWTEEEMIVSLFSSFNLRFFVSMASWDRGSFFIPFTRACLSLLFLVAILAKTGSKKEVSSKKNKKKTKKKKKKKQKGKKEIHVLFSSRRIFLSTYSEGLGPRQWLYKWRESTRSSKSSISLANSKATWTQPW